MKLSLLVSVVSLTFTTFITTSTASPVNILSVVESQDGSPSYLLNSISSDSSRRQRRVPIPACIDGARSAVCRRLTQGHNPTAQDVRRDVIRRAAAISSSSGSAGILERKDTVISHLLRAETDSTISLKDAYVSRDRKRGIMPYSPESLPFNKRSGSIEGLISAAHA